MYSHVEQIKSRLTKEDEKFLKDIYAPTEVTKCDEDAFRRLCVTPDGKIRFYGLYGKKVVNDINALDCYIESADGGLSVFCDMNLRRQCHLRLAQNRFIVYGFAAAEYFQVCTGTSRGGIVHIILCVQIGSICDAGGIQSVAPVFHIGDQLVRGIDVHIDVVGMAHSAIRGYVFTGSPFPPL